MYMVTLRTEEVVYNLGRGHLIPGRQGGLKYEMGPQLLLELQEYREQRVGKPLGVRKPV